jgi:streptogramin lyase
MTRREFLSLAATVPATLSASSIATQQVHPVKVFDSPGPNPNGLQATAEGLWILDQGDNHAYLVSYEDGKVLRDLDTDSDRGSGITFDGQALWIASTYDCKILKVDEKTGKTLASFETPGCGRVKWGNNPNQPSTGAHGCEFKDGKFWLAVPPSMKIYRINPEGFQVEKEYAAPGERPHGIGWEGDSLWCTESNHRAFYRLDLKTGEYTKKLQLSDKDPEPHGMTVWKQQLWYSDAETRAVCRFAL